MLNYFFVMVIVVNNGLHVFQCKLNITHAFYFQILDCTSKAFLDAGSDSIVPVEIAVSSATTLSSDCSTPLHSLFLALQMFLVLFNTVLRILEWDLISQFQPFLLSSICVAESSFAKLQKFLTQDDYFSYGTPAHSQRFINNIPLI